MRIPFDARLALGLLASSALALGAFVVVGFGPLPSRALHQLDPRGVDDPPVAGTEFVDASVAWGLGGFRHQFELGVRSIADAVAPGLGLVDLDRDSDLDLVLLGGPGAERGVSILLNRLQDRGERRFEDVTEAVGIEWRGAAQGVCAGDVDNDGDLDLFVTALGPNLLLLSQLEEEGELGFVDATADAYLEGGRWHWVPSADPQRSTELRMGPPPAELGSAHEVPEFSTGASFGDFDADGDLDLYVANYVAYYERRVQALQAIEADLPERNEPLEYLPRVFEPQQDRLYLNELSESDQYFVEATQKANLDDAGGRGLGAVFMLVDGDLFPDVYVVNDASDNVFFFNERVPADQPGDLRRRFDDVTVRIGLNDPNSGMGIARGDADGDGDLDILTTNWRFQSASLFLFRREARHRPGEEPRLEPMFEERGDRAGLGRATLPFVGWGCAFLDYDNDGDEDVFIGNGFTSPRKGALACAAEKPLLLQNDGAGHFADVTASSGPALSLPYAARGAVAGDVDQDGDLDLVIAQNAGPVILLENRLDNGNYSLTLALDLLPLRADAVNVKVVADVGGRKLVRELLAGDSYLCQGPFEAHFGLGELPRADRVRVTLPWAAARPPFFLGSALRENEGEVIPAGRRRESLGAR